MTTALTIVHVGGTRKRVELEDITPQGWVQVRYPNGGGCYRFSLIHGRAEATKRGEEPLWSLDPADLASMRALAKERGIKPRNPRQPGRPGAPKKRPPSKQRELFADEA